MFLRKSKPLSILATSLFLAGALIPVTHVAEQASASSSCDVTFDGTYEVEEKDDGAVCWVTFKSDGELDASSSSLTITEIVAIGGGGGGGSNVGQGGKGGSLVHWRGSLALDGSTSVTVGAGGAGGAGINTDANTAGNNGGDGGQSRFSGITADGSFEVRAGGGHGGEWKENTRNEGNGASTVAMPLGTTTTYGTYSGGYGGAGGDPSVAIDEGEPGGNGSILNSSFLDLSVPGGGGGGNRQTQLTSGGAAGGNAGGGAAAEASTSRTRAAQPGVTNSGGGGGGGLYYNSGPVLSGANGGSGIIKIAYLNSIEVSSFTTTETSPSNSSTIDYSLEFTQDADGIEGTDFENGASSNAATGCVFTPSSSSVSTGNALTLSVSGCSDGVLTPRLKAGEIHIAGSSSVTGPPSNEDGPTITIDKTAPDSGTVSAVTSSPTNATNVEFEITFNESVTGLSTGDLTLTGTGCTLGTLTGSNTTFNQTVTGCDDETTATLTVDSSSVQDLAGNPSPVTPSNTASIIIDRVPASVTDFSVLQENDNGLVVYNLEFDEPVTGLASADLSAAGVSVVSPFGVNAISSTQYEITAQALSSGDLTLTLGADTVEDGPGNLSPAASFPSATETISFDDLAGAITASPSLTEFGKTKESNLSWTVVVSRAIDSGTGANPGNSSNMLEAGEISVVTGTCSSTSVATDPLTATTFEILATCSDGEVVLEIAAGSIVDPDGDSWPAEPLSTSVVMVDTVLPTVTSQSPATPNQLDRQVFEFEFSEPVYGITIDDFSTTGTATGCSLSLESVSTTEYLVQAEGCSAGTVGIELQSDAATDQAGNLGPASALTTTPVTKQAPIVPDTETTTGENLEPKLIAISPDRFVGPLSNGSKQALVAAGVVRSFEDTTLHEVEADFTDFASPTDDAEMSVSVTMQTGETLTALTKYDASFNSTHEVIGYMRTDTSWIDLGTTEITADGVLTTPAAFATPGEYFIRIIAKQPPMGSFSTVPTGAISDPILNITGQVLEISITVTGDAIELIIPPAPSYTGPVLQASGKRVSSLGGEVSFDGARLGPVDEIVINGISMKITDSGNDQITVMVSPMEPGNYSVELRGSSGRITVLDALTVYLEIGEVNTSSEAPNFVTKRISDTEVKVYAKNVVGIGKVQFMVNRQEIAWLRTTDPMHPKIRNVMLDGKQVSYLVRTVMVNQKVRIEIRLNGDREKAATYNPR